MAATFLGTTGNWGIPNDESGIIVTDLSFDYSNQEKVVLDKGGEIIGLALYQEKAEIKLSGLVKKAGPFAGKIGAALAIANAIPQHMQSSGGVTIIKQISRNLNNEDFEKIDITATNYPMVSSSGAS
jgi:hypothetical protein